MHDRRVGRGDAGRRAVRPRTTRPSATGPEPPRLPAEGVRSRRILGRPPRRRRDGRADRRAPPERRRSVGILCSGGPGPSPGSWRLRRDHEIWREERPPRWGPALRSDDGPPRGLGGDRPVLPCLAGNPFPRALRPDWTRRGPTLHAGRDRGEGGADSRAVCRPRCGGPNGRGDRGSAQRSGQRRRDHRGHGDRVARGRRGTVFRVPRIRPVPSVLLDSRREGRRLRRRISRGIDARERA